MVSNIERWYSMKEICEYLGVSRDTVLDWIDNQISEAYMSFIESYKHLDKICGEMFETQYGVSTYI